MSYDDSNELYSLNYSTLNIAHLEYFQEKEGTIVYAQLDLAKVRANSPIIGKEQLTDYASIEFSKRAPPTPIEEPEPPAAYMASREEWEHDSYDRDKS